MAEHALKEEYPVTDEIYDYDNIITEDDAAVDNIFSEKQQRLLTESLNVSWEPGRPFLALADVGIFYAPHQPPVVPDVLVSLDVRAARDLWKKKNRSYFVQVFGKPPEIAVEVVSNREGGEIGPKFRKYARAGVRYYIVMDPGLQIQKDILRVYELSAGQYIPMIGSWLTDAGLGITVWEGEFDGIHQRWLRWTDRNGNLILTGRERAESAEITAAEEQQRAEKERQRAESAEITAAEEHQRAEKERQRAERLAEKLRQMGADPDEIGGIL